MLDLTKANIAFSEMLILLRVLKLCIKESTNENTDPTRYSYLQFASWRGVLGLHVAHRDRRIERRAERARRHLSDNGLAVFSQYVLVPCESHAIHENNDI